MNLGFELTESFIMVFEVLISKLNVSSQGTPTPPLAAVSACEASFHADLTESGT
jgi:hypothetical protein